MRVFQNGYIRRMTDTVPYGTGPNNVIADWRYATNDDATAVETAGHFNGLATVLNKGSLIFCSLDLDGTPVSKIYMVRSIVAGVVTVVSLIATAAA